MLAQLGPLSFEVVPFGMESHDHEAGASFASHEVLGRMPPLEFVGEAAESWTVRGKLFTQAFSSSGLDQINALHAMRRTGVPQFFMRGDGVPMGWVVVESIREKSSILAADGVGKVIEFEVGLKASDPPDAAGVLNSLMSLFG
jgi:phage protein U